MLPRDAVHVTEVLLLLPTVALNCSVPEEATVDVVGEIEMDRGTIEFVLPALMPAQARDRAVRQRIANISGIAVLAGKVPPLRLVSFPAIHLAGIDLSPAFALRRKTSSP